MREPCYKCKFENKPIDKEPCEHCSDEYMNSGDHPAFEYSKKQTHYDEIRAMSIEELAEWVDHIQADAYERGMMETPVVDYPNVYSDWLAWLEKEVDE